MRPCLGVDGARCAALVTGSRCDRCAAIVAGRSRAAYQGSWRRSAEKLVAHHRVMYGDWCPGWHRVGHVATDLVVDHDEGVICRVCNSSKAGSVDRAAAQTRKRGRSDS